MNIIFLILKWRIRRKIKWMDDYCVKLEEAILKLETSDIDIFNQKKNIPYVKNQLEIYKKKIRELKIQYGINEA
jgi:hypothetical protein